MPITKLLEGPSIDPVSLNQLKAHLRIEDSDPARDDDLLRKLRSAINQVQGFLGRQLIQARYPLFLDSFSDLASSTLGERWTSIKMPFAPLKSINAIRYVDLDGETVTLTDPAPTFTVDTNSEPGRLMLAFGKSLPGTRSVSNAVEIDFTCGYGATIDDVPEDICLSICQLVAHYDGNRSAFDGDSQPRAVPETYKSGLWQYRMIANA